LSADVCTFDTCCPFDCATKLLSMYGHGPPPAGRPTGGTAGTDGFAGAAELDGDAAAIGGGAAD
jgi:hypothetical protein